MTIRERQTDDVFRADPDGYMAVMKDGDVVAWVVPVEPPDDLLERAWTIIANANEGDWESATDEWREAAEAWRERYHEWLREVTEAGGAPLE